MQRLGKHGNDDGLAGPGCCFYDAWRGGGFPPLDYSVMGVLLVVAWLQAHGLPQLPILRRLPAPLFKVCIGSQRFDCLCVADGSGAFDKR